MSGKTSCLQLAAQQAENEGATVYFFSANEIGPKEPFEQAFRKVIHQKTSWAELRLLRGTVIPA